MRALKFGLAAVAMAFAVSACSAKSGAIAPVKTTPAELEKYVEKLAAEPFKTEAKGPADLASVRDALPKAVSLTWASLDFDAATGATVLKDVKLTPADKPEIGVGISELRVWDFNTELAKARLQGQRLTETGDLARRVEATGTSLFGLETLMAPAMEAYTGAIESTVTAQLPPEVAAEMTGSMQTTLDDYEFSIGHFVFDDVKLRPYELKLAQLPPENDFAEVMPLLQSFVAVSRSFGVDTFFMHQFKGQMAMTQAGQKMSINFAADTYGIRGMRGSDTDAAFIRGVTFDMDAPTGMADASSGTVMPAMKIAGGIDYMSMEGIRLDKVAAYLARGEWPPRAEADLMSYGLINVKNEHVAINGHDVYSVGEVVVDARKWHWFIPTKVSIKTNDIVYDVKALMDFASEMERATSPGAPEATSPDGAAEPDGGPAQLIDPAIMQLLTKYGLDKPSLDFALGWDWNPNSGAAVVTTAFGLDDYMRTDLKYEGGFPTFKGVSDLIPGGFETAKGEEIGALFQKASTLKMVELNVVDEGGLDKMFALAAEAGKMMPPDQTGGVAVFANATPASLRQMASAGVYMAADQAAAMASGLKEMIVPFGTFIEKGGRVQFTLKPKTPVVLASLEERQDIRTGQVSPAQLLVEWNGKTVHTPPGPVKP
jgi:hypothetical protein